MENLTTQNVEPKESDILNAKLERRSFLQYAGAGAAALALTAAGCKKDRGNPGPIIGGGVTLDFKDDFGVLNYAYALEQLEAAFYIQVANSNLTFTHPRAKEYFNDIRYHEVAHREFFKKALGTAAIGSLEVDFSSIKFDNEASVLATAQAFEDLGVAAYNGAGVRIKDTDYLVIAGQIVSVEARHAALIRDLISNGSFANLDTLSALGSDNASGRDAALAPNKVLEIASKYIKTKINVINL